MRAGVSPKLSALQWANSFSVSAMWLLSLLLLCNRGSQKAEGKAVLSPVLLYFIQAEGCRAYQCSYRQAGI